MGLSRLEGLEVLEVSLVKRGANGKRVALTKEQDGMDPILKTALETECELEKALPEIADANAAEALKVAARAIAAYTLDETTLAAVQKSLFGDKAEQVIEEKEMPEIPEEVKAQLEALQKSNEAEREAREKLEKQLAEERAARQHTALVQKCSSELSHVGNAETLATILQAVEGTPAGEKLGEVLKQVEAQLAEGALFAKHGESPKASEAKTEIESRIADLRKAEPGLAYESAYVRVVKSNPELKARLREETR